MASLIGLFYEPPAVPAAPNSPAQTAEANPEALRQDFKTLLRQVAPVYERLSSVARKAFILTWSALQERMDLAHQEGARAEFQAALVEAKARLAEAKGAMLGKAR